MLHEDAARVPTFLTEVTSLFNCMFANRVDAKRLDFAICPVFSEYFIGSGRAIAWLYVFAR